MKTDEEIEAFCTSGELARAADEINEWQKSIVHKFRLPLTIGVLSLIAGLCLFVGSVPHVPDWLYLVLIAGTLIGLIWFLVLYFHLASGKRQRYKSKIVETAVRFFDPELEFYPDRVFSSKIYNASGLYTQRYDNYKGEDLVCGNYHSIPVEFSQLRTQYETRDKDGHTQTHDIFNGIFFAAEFNKNFNTRIMVLPDIAENVFGQWLGNALQKMNLLQEGKLCKMEDPEFEKAFAVYSDNDVETRYVLSPSLMRRMLDLRARMGKTMRFSFTASKLIIAISDTTDFFECGAFEPITEASVKRPVMQLYSMLAIVDDLSLETRIWSKT